MDPTVTVLMPVRNGARDLGAACASVLEQSEPDFEFLIIDDGSTDSTLRLSRDIAARDPRVRILRQDASGIVSALNRGLREARAPLIARMDADDLCLPGRFAAQSAWLQGHPSVAALGTGWRVIDSAGAGQKVVTPPSPADAVRSVLAERNCLAHPSVMFRRDLVLSAGGYREALTGAEDYDLWLRLSETYDVENLSEPLIALRDHPNQVTKLRLEQRILAEIAANWLHICRRMGSEPAFDREHRVTRSIIAGWGMPTSDLASAIIARALGAAHDALDGGDPATARVAAQLVLAEAPPRLRTRVHARWLGIRAGLRSVGFGCTP